MNCIKRKKILSLEDLENFYLDHKRSAHFSSKESGYQLAVHVPAQFEIAEEMGDDTVLFAKARVFHLGVNRNKSSVTKEAAEKAMKTMAYKPVLAGFTDVNGELDFTSHDMEIDEENDKIIYLEKQIGCITADEPWFEEDKELDKTYVCAYVAIPREYTEAANVIERKNGTKVSVELLINEMNFSGKDKCLELTDVIVQGLTALGTNPNTGEAVEEGMYGSKITLKDFSESNNSMFSSINEEDKNKLIEMQNTINEMVSRFNINKADFSANNHGKEEFNFMDEVKVNEEINEEIVETESTEEVTAENSEETVDTPEVVEVEKCKTKKCSEEDEESEEVVETEKCKTKKCSEEDFEEDSVETFDDEDESDDTEDDVEETEETTDVEVDVIENEENSEEIAEDVLDGDTSKPFSKTFELSFDDIRCSLYALLSAYESANNDWYWITSIYDDHFVYQGMMGDYHGQKYVKNDDDTVSFDGEPYNLYAEFLTDSELAALTEMRSNYSSIQTELNAYKDAEVMSDKMTVFEDEAYSAYLETEEFKNLMKEDFVKQFSKEELVEKADAALGKVVKATKTFAMETKKEEPKKASFFAFAKQETQSSFLDGLLKK